MVCCGFILWCRWHETDCHLWYFSLDFWYANYSACVVCLLFAPNFDNKFFPFAYLCHLLSTPFSLSFLYHLFALILISFVFHIFNRSDSIEKFPHCFSLFILWIRTYVMAEHDRNIIVCNMYKENLKSVSNTIHRLLYYILLVSKYIQTHIIYIFCIKIVYDILLAQSLWSALDNYFFFRLMHTILL